MFNRRAFLVKSARVWNLEFDLLLVCLVALAYGISRRVTGVIIFFPFAQLSAVLNESENRRPSFGGSIQYVTFGFRPFRDRY